MEIFIPNDINEIKGLPDKFYYDLYQELSKERDLSRWAFEFVSRQDGMTKEKLLKITGGIRYNIDGTEIKTQWKSGVFITGNLNAHESIDYLEDININYLNEAKGIFVPDDEIDKYKDVIKNSKINSSLGNPIQKAYKKHHHKLGRTYFPNTDIYWNYHNKSNKFNNKTASFLVNLEMPSHKILAEIKNRLTIIKEKKNIVEVKSKYYKYNTWAMGLACFDLKKGGIKPDVIKRKYLSFCYDGSQIPDSKILTEDDNNRWKDNYDAVIEMINNGWKSLIGYPE